MFFCSMGFVLMAVGVLWGFAKVDRAADLYGFGGIVGTMEVTQEEELSYLVSSQLGTVRVDLTPLNQLAGWVHRYETYVVPRPIRILSKAVAVVNQSYHRAKEDRLEREFLTYSDRAK